MKPLIYLAYVALGIAGSFQIYKYLKKASFTGDALKRMVLPGAICLCLLFFGLVFLSIGYDIDDVVNGSLRSPIDIAGVVIIHGAWFSLIYLFWVPQAYVIEGRIKRSSKSYQILATLFICAFVCAYWFGRTGLWPSIKERILQVLD